MEKRSLHLILASLLFIILVAGGTSGYMLLEQYSFADALYMTIITVTTVGFGEVKPLSDMGRIFTSLLILFGFASLAFAANALMDALLHNLMSLNSEKQKMEKQISKLESHYIICGFGRVGAAAWESFIEAGVNAVIIEASHENYSALCEKNYLCIEGNAIEEETLEYAKIKQAKGLLAILPSDPDNLFITLTARELNPTLHIIARAQNIAAEKKLLHAGADKVISPYTSAGRKIANDMLAAAGMGVHSKSQDLNNTLTQAYDWLEINEDSELVGRLVSDFAKQKKGEILGLRRESRDYLTPSPQLVLMPGDMILFTHKTNTSTNHQIRKQYKQKVVLVDDNSVVLRLYSRIFRRAGFIVKTATNGNDALSLIQDEMPVAAVIDYNLPILSGIDICKGIRQNQDCNGIKLVLFTGHEEIETRERALAVGADAVVQKSPEASELLQTVVHLLRKESDDDVNRLATETPIKIVSVEKTDVTKI